MVRAALLSIALALGLAGVAHADPALPDLVADPVERPIVDEYSLAVNGHVPRRLLRFDGFVHNQGDGALEVRGTTPVEDVMGEVVQVVGGDPRAMPGAARVLFENDDLHNHWHLRSIARYSLWTEHGQAEVAPSSKVGFCLLDSQHVDPHGPEERHEWDLDADWDCEAGNDDAADVTMGVSAGWRDVYGRTTTFQWVDVSDVQPGRFLIKSEIDPENVVVEEHELNPPTVVPFTIPGYVAEPTAATSNGLAVTVPLKASRVGTPIKAAQFRIEDAPRHGTLSVAPGQWFTGDTVTYTPDLGATGTDTFTVSARESTVNFPVSPARATVTIANGEAHRLVISGAPAQVQTGSLTQLTAAVDGVRDPGTLSWSSTAGSVTATGLFRAPKDVPRSRSVTVRARNAVGMTAEIRMRVAPRPKATAAPSVEARGKGVLAMGARRIDGKLVAAVRARRSGRLRLTFISGSRRVRSCVLRVLARRTYTCRVKAPRRRGALRVVATLRLPGGALKQRQVVLGTARAAAHDHTDHEH